MSNRFPSKEAVARLRGQYTEGTRIELVSMNDAHSTLRPGDRGTVSFVDDTGTIFVNWDNGSGLGVVYSEDRCRKITERTYETGADFFRDTAVSHGMEEALGICGRYLGTQLRSEQSEYEHKFCRELFAAMYEAAAERTDSAKLVYPYEFQKANERLEGSLYHAGRKLNNECARAIDEAIHASCYAPNYYNLDLAAMKAVHDFGFTRVNLVLAYNFQKREYDGRFSTSNKLWAREMPVVDKAFDGAILHAHPILIEDFANHARRLYDMVGADHFIMPGRPESGEDVHGYEIVHSIAFDDQRGFAIGQNPVAGSPFVCWQFTVEKGRRDFYWGHYADDLASVANNYIARIMVHMDGGDVKEIIPLAAVEVSREQNYNMIDGLRNNEAAPRADLTDGQTYGEIRELAPETISDEEHSVGVENITSITAEPSVTQQDMNDYGYIWNGMMPITKVQALQLFDQNQQVYILYEDNTERAVDSRDEIEAFHGMFGVEKLAYDRGERKPLRELVATDDKPSVVEKIKEARQATVIHEKNPSKHKRDKGGPEL